ncbi:MAG TPA: hypothetical protein VIQ30_26875, partial [Pseudonocardia sp.]
MGLLHGLAVAGLALVGGLRVAGLTLVDGVSGLPVRVPGLLLGVPRLLLGLAGLWAGVVVRLAVIPGLLALRVARRRLLVSQWCGRGLGGDLHRRERHRCRRRGRMRRGRYWRRRMR